MHTPYRAYPRTRFILWALVASIAVFIAWMWWVEIEQVVRAEGKIIPSGDNRTVQHLEGGIVAEILVREGDVVEEGDVLFRIRNAYATADLNELEVEFMALEAAKVRLTTQLAGNSEVPFSDELTARVPTIVGLERQILQDSLHNFNKQQQVLEASVREKEFVIKEQEILLANLAQELKLQGRDLEISQELLDKGALSEKNVLDAKKQYQVIKTRYDATQAAIPSIRAQMREAESRIEQNKANYTLELRKQLNEVEGKIGKINERKKGRRDRLVRADVVASVHGIVNTLNINTIGGIVRPGDVLASITPLDSGLLVEARVKESDRAEIWQSQSATVKMRAYNFSTHGSLTGNLAFISPDSFQDTQNGQYFYEVRININETALAPDKPILPGMVVDVDLLAGKKTILEYVLNPVGRVFDIALREG